MGSETGQQQSNDLVGEQASPAQIAGPLIDRLRQVLAVRAPVFVAIDGRSGSGKSTLSEAVVEALDVSGRWTRW